MSAVKLVGRRADMTGRGIEMSAAGEHLQLSQKHLQRERLLDMEARLKPYRVAAFAVLAAALVVSGPELGWWWLAPLGAAFAAFKIGDAMVVRKARPERWIGAYWAISPLMIALSVALTGGPESPAIPWFALPAVTLGARFENRGIGLGLIWITLLLVGSTCAVDPAAFVDDPLPIVFVLRPDARGDDPRRGAGAVRPRPSP